MLKVTSTPVRKWWNSGGGHEERPLD